MKVESNSVVILHFEVKDDNGEVIENTRESQPLEFMMGSGYLVPGLEAELNGLSVGSEFEVTVEPAQGYGIYDPELVQEVPADLFADVEDLAPGMAFQAETDAGHLTVIVTGVEEDIITVDANHPFAGRTLQFTGEILGIREATAEEMEHGHIHTADGCCGGHEEQAHGGCGCGNGEAGGCCGGEGDADKGEEKGGCCGGGHCH